MTDFKGSTAEMITKHILKHLAAHRGTNSASPKPPLFVAFQGPQGSGKTFLTSELKTSLSNEPHSLNVAVLSIDDLYLPHSGLTSLANRHPANKLWKGRGQPGTHDVELGAKILGDLAMINEGGRVVQLPVFDKSLHDGEGDRLPLGIGNVIHAPLDIVLFEGWCTGFYPIPAEELQRRWVDVWPLEKVQLGLGSDEDEVCRREDIVMVNESLKQYIDLWKRFGVFIQLQPQVVSGRSAYDVIYKWRLQQEHYMKANNGGRGMSDEAVKSFVDRYIPGYVFFGDGVSKRYQMQDGPIDHPPWLGNGIRLVLGEDRELVTVEEF